MKTPTRRRIAWGILAAVLFAAPVDALAQSARAGAASAHNEAVPRKQVSENRYTAGFITGPPYSTEFAMVQDIATVLASGQKTGPHGEVALRVLPMVGTGGVRNISDLLTLAGADMAIAPVVLVDRLRDAKTFGDINHKLVYITLLHTEEFHLLVRPEIKSLDDLAGKTVSLGEADSTEDVLGREAFDTLGVKVNAVNLGLDAALERMRRGQASAVLLLSGKPIKPLLALNTRLDNLRLLPIPYSQSLQREFLPSTLDHADYPNIIADGQKVETIAIQSALFAYNWPAGSPRYDLLENFTRSFFSRFSEFLGDGHAAKWREVNLAARLPGWQRFGPAEHWLNLQSMGADAARNGSGNAGSAPNPAANSSEQRDQLFREFLQWRDRQQQGK
ncbi:TAXI family TRAP transporter solute-binding subunit [Bradyrhizobium sp.]|uniref:TAXI family TRAP transporter solute-binding subunit n=1 Tax=Bradyrhizobium sp. TaxID=376 RepID=UPI00262160FE|nr:TAXI family TRAP transporter solute-binding subunit [Bradyrhizobium sp.]